MACRLDGAKPLSEPMLDGILLIGPLGTNFSEILVGIQTFSFRKMHLKMSSALQRPFRLGVNELKHQVINRSSAEQLFTAFD